MKIVEYLIFYIEEKDFPASDFSWPDNLLCSFEVERLQHSLMRVSVISEVNGLQIFSGILAPLSGACAVDVVVGQARLGAEGYVFGQCTTHEDFRGQGIYRCAINQTMLYLRSMHPEDDPNLLLYMSCRSQNVGSVRGIEAAGLKIHARTHAICIGNAKIVIPRIFPHVSSRNYK